MESKENKSLKICFYCDTIFSFGGVQRVLAVIAKALSVHHQVTILTLDSPASEDQTMYELQDSNIQFRHLQFPPQSIKGEYFLCKAYSFLYKKVLPQNELTSRWYGHSSFPPSKQRVLIDCLNRYDYDVIVGVHAFLSLRLASVREQLTARRVIGWMHNSYQAFFENQPSYLEGLKSHFLYQMKQLDEVVVLTHADKALYEKELNLHPVVIYNPLTLIPQGCSNPKAKKFLAIGRFSARHKGFDILIEGFALFARQNKDWTLEIVGEGSEEKMLRGLIAKHGLEGRISIHPFTKEIQKHYAAASVYVLSSRWEGFGLVLLEAMAHKLPIIASDISVVKEVLKGTDALFFKSEQVDDLCQQMLHMADYPSLTALGENLFNGLEKYDINQISPQWDNVMVASTEII